MPFHVIIGAVTLSLSVPILWYALAGHRDIPAGLTDGMGDVGSITDARTLLLRESMWRRMLAPAATSFGRLARTITPAGWMSSLRRHLLLAGKADGHAFEAALAAKLVLGGVGVTGWLLAPEPAPGPRMLLAGIFGLVGFVLPDAWAGHTAELRQRTIEKELADTIDQVTMSVEAGLGFEAALARVARAGDGPLAAELSRTLREIQLGMPRHEALRALADRTDVADLDTFVLAVIQSERYGLPVAQVLQVQAEEIRDKRSQRAEERALRIPVLLVFPLAFCIFPAMFIVLLGPAVIRIVRDLGPAL
jgi:tight adherence protein C